MGEKEYRNPFSSFASPKWTGDVPTGNPDRGGVVSGAVASGDCPSNPGAAMTANVAAGGGDDDVRSDIGHVRRFLCDVGMGPETVDKASWAKLRGHVRGRMNLSPGVGIYFKSWAF